MRERLHWVLGQLGSKLWLSWQPKALIDVNGEMMYPHFLNHFYTKLAGIQDRRKISDEFNYQPDWIIHFSAGNILHRLQLLIGSLSNLQVTRTGIRSQMNSNYGLIRLVTLELFALDC